VRRAPWIVQSGEYDLRRHQVAEFEFFARADSAYRYRSTPVDKALAIAGVPGVW
jgi:hypothetical protein